MEALPKKIHELFKRYLVEMIIKNNGDINKIAKQLDVSYRTVYRWAERYDLLVVIQEHREAANVGNR